MKKRKCSGINSDKLDKFSSGRRNTYASDVVGRCKGTYEAGERPGGIKITKTLHRQVSQKILQ